ncbi:unnamed protein product [Tetraodon nigroviridis]|uniref:(spotted green pufferfish) hypothetical protein n=1 Tax=Tetraodon nigroviridis TaxID=99883 RepID=Q4SCY5_TETNG|nr:unnamed protein product [Tetraodon nigroviridis]
MLKAQGKSGGQTGIKILLEAMSHDKVHLARFVLDALDGEIVDSTTEDAQTPLIISILLPEGHTRCKFAELLLQRGASVNRQDGNGRTALSYACENGYLDAVKILVQNNADPEIVDTWGNTALMYAVVAGHAPVVEFLVRAFKRLGLQVDRQNKVGNSAAKVAHFLGHAECICALKTASRKSSVVEKDGREAPRHSLDVGDRSDHKVGYLVKKVELLQTNDRETLQIAPNTFLQKRLRKNQSGLPSVGSIEESETESDASFSPTQTLNFSGVPSLKPARRLTANDDHLSRLAPKREAPKQPAFSPRPNRNAFELGAPSPLSILMTPIGEKDEQITETPDCGVRSFHDSYYHKRYSLPTSLLSPMPPERTLEPVRKSRDGASRRITQTATAPPTTFSALSDKLFRRFTSPEFRKHKGAMEEEPTMAPGRMPRSETFPRDVTHPQVGSQPSIDSISSVMCEFDFHLRTQKL